MSFVNSRVNSASFPSNVFIKSLCVMGGNVYAMDANGSGGGTYPRYGSLWRLNGTSWDLLIDDNNNGSNRILAHSSSVIRVNTNAFRGIYSWSSGSAWTQLGTSSSFTAHDAVSVGGSLYIMTEAGVGTLSGATLTMVATFSGSGMPLPYGGYPYGYRLVSYASGVYVISENGRLWRLSGSSLISTLPAPHSDRRLGSTFRGRNPFEVNGILYYASQCANSTVYNPITDTVDTALQNGQLFSYSGSGSAWTTLVPGVSGAFYYDLCAGSDGTIFISAQSGGYGSYIYDPSTSSLLPQDASMGSWESSTLFGSRLLNNGISSYLSELMVYVPPPVAAFSATPLAGLNSLSVQFTDSSTGSPTSWLWDFGDGHTSTSQNPTHVYSSLGTYSVTLTTTNTGGSDNEVKASYVVVLPAIGTLKICRNSTLQIDEVRIYDGTKDLNEYSEFIRSLLR